MSNQTSESSFPNTREDLSSLKKTAVDATQDLVSTAGVHAAKASDQAKKLVSHAREEGQVEVDRVKVRLTDLGHNFREFVSERPFASIGAALAVGFLFGVTRPGCSSNR